MKRWIGGAVLALVLVVAGTAAYMARQVETGVATSNAFTSIRELPSPLVGQAAPAIGLEPVVAGSGSLDLEEHQGKLVLVSFWSDF